MILTFWNDISVVGWTAWKNVLWPIDTNMNGSLCPNQTQKIPLLDGHLLHGAIILEFHANPPSDQPQLMHVGQFTTLTQTQSQIYMEWFWRRREERNTDNNVNTLQSSPSCEYIMIRTRNLGSHCIKSSRRLVTTLALLKNQTCHGLEWLSYKKREVLHGDSTWSMAEVSGVREASSSSSCQSRQIALIRANSCPPCLGSVAKLQ